jgi:hypothetical protein
MTATGVKENNRYVFKGAKTKIDNATSVDLPFNLALNTSVLIMDGWDIESNVNNTLFTITSGKVILRNCKIKQTANQPIFNISAGATVVLEHTDCVVLDTTQYLSSTGAGTILSKYSTSNVPLHPDMMGKGKLDVSPDYSI